MLLSSLDVTEEKIDSRQGYISLNIQLPVPGGGESIWNVSIEQGKCKVDLSRNLLTLLRALLWLESFIYLLKNNTCIHLIAHSNEYLIEPFKDCNSISILQQVDLEHELMK